MKDPREMKKWIASKGPVVTSMYCDESFLNHRGEVYETGSQKYLGVHAVCCIGYDDGRQAWLCKNSFGPDWGILGYVWVGYGTCGIDRIMFGINGFSHIYTRPIGSAPACPDRLSPKNIKNS